MIGGRRLAGFFKSGLETCFMVFVDLLKSDFHHPSSKTPKDSYRSRIINSLETKMQSRLRASSVHQESSYLLNVEGSGIRHFNTARLILLFALVLFAFFFNGRIPNLLTSSEKANRIKSREFTLDARQWAKVLKTAEDLRRVFLTP